jgi:hypothetical protein
VTTFASGDILATPEKIMNGDLLRRKLCKSHLLEFALMTLKQSLLLFHHRDKVCVSDNPFVLFPVKTMI